MVLFPRIEVIDRLIGGQGLFGETHLDRKLSRHTTDQEGVVSVFQNLSGHPDGRLDPPQPAHRTHIKGVAKRG